MVKPRNNPFAAYHIDKLHYRFTHLDWRRLSNTLRSLNYRASIVGPQGTGKTTLLDQLADLQRNQGFRAYKIFVNDRKAFLNFQELRKIHLGCNKETIIYIDGADLMPKWQWAFIKLISRRAKGLIIACHRLDYLPILIQCQPTLSILDDVLKELVGPVEEDLNQASHKLFYQHNGNIRKVFRDLYMLYANL